MEVLLSKKQGEHYNCPGLGMCMRSLLPEQESLKHKPLATALKVVCPIRYLADTLHNSGGATDCPTTSPTPRKHSELSEQPSYIDIAPAGSEVGRGDGPAAMGSKLALRFSGLTARMGLQNYMHPMKARKNWAYTLGATATMA